MNQCSLDHALGSYSMDLPSFCRSNLVRKNGLVFFTIEAVISETDAVKEESIGETIIINTSWLVPHAVSQARALACRVIKRSCFVF